MLRLDTLSVGMGFKIVVLGLDDSDVERHDEFSLEQDETSEPLEEKIIQVCIFTLVTLCSSLHYKYVV